MGNVVLAAPANASLFLCIQETSYIGEGLIAIIDDGFRSVDTGPEDPL